jgi:hypothetical protein
MNKLYNDLLSEIIKCCDCKELIYLHSTNQQISKLADKHIIKKQYKFYDAINTKSLLCVKWWIKHKSYDKICPYNFLYATKTKNLKILKLFKNLNFSLVHWSYIDIPDSENIYINGLEWILKNSGHHELLSSKLSKVSRWFILHFLHNPILLYNI